MSKKSLLMMLLMAIFVPWAANAQSVTLGSGTSTSSYLPSYSYYNYSISQQIYTAEEISASGNITSIAFYNGGAVKSRQFDIYMAHTSKSAFESTSDWIDVPESAIVYSDAEGSTTTMTADAWTTFTLDTPFNYNGTDNLVVVVIDRTGDYSNSPHMACRTYSTTEYQALYCYNDNYNEITPNGTNGGTAFSYTLGRPQFKNQIVLGGIQQAYPTPTDLTVSGLTATSATLNWTENGTATSWEVAYKAANDEEFTTVTTSTKPYTIEGLTPQTAYTAKVRAYYSATVQSNWTSELSFTTNELCPDGKICIGSGTATNSYIPTYTYYNYSLTQQIYTAEEIGAEGYILSVDFHASAAKTRTLDIYMVSTDKNSFSGATDWITVTADDKVFSGSVTFAAGDWTTIEFDTPFNYDGRNNVALIVDDNTGTYESSPSFYAFSATSQAIRIYSDGTNYDPLAPTSYSGTVLTQKNRVRLAVGVPPTCPKPKNLAASNVTNHTATLTWTAGGEETEWTVEYSAREDFAGAETMTVNNTPTASLTGLEAESVYYARVKANCGVGDESEWTDAISFETEVACPAPTNLTVSDITATSASVSWTGVASGYNLRYREMTAEDFATITFAPNDVWQDGTGYQLLLDADANTYGTIIPENGGLTSSGNASAAVYAEFEYKIPANADGAMNTQNVLIGTSVTIQVPAGTFDWCVTNPTPGDRIWIAGEGRANDYVFEGGKTYLFVVQSNGDGGDEVVVTVTEPGSAKDVVWTEINNVTSPYTISVNPEKDYIVEVQANCGDDGTSAWVSTNFSTPSNCQVPTPLDVTDITASTATLNWTGLQDSYEVQYRTKGSRELLFFESFDSQPSTWTLTNAAYDRTSSQTSDYFVYLGYNSTETAYVITPDLTDIVSVGTVEFYHRCYNGDATFQVGFSSTTNDVDAFTWGDEVNAAGVFFTAYSVSMPAGTKYVAVKSTTSATDNYVFINDFGIYGNEIPAGQWNTATANTTSCPISGLEANTEYEWQVRGVNESCGGYTEWCDLVTFTTEVSCPVPTNVTVSDVTGESAVIAWTSDASLFDIDVNGVVTNGVTNPYTLENLDPATIYSVKVRANCGNGDYSEWSESYAFVTDCGGAKELPYTYGFEDLGEYYACWGTYAEDGNNNNLGISTYDDAYDGSNVFVFSSYTNYSTDYDQYLFLPEFNSENNVAFEFYYRTPQGYGTETFEVGYSADGEEYTWSEEIATNTTEWTPYTDVLPAGTKYVVVHYYSNYQYYLLVDGFKFEESTGATQVLELTAGYNWVSLYIDSDPMELLEALQEGLGENGVSIEGPEGLNENLGEGTWWGDLDYVGLTSGTMYLVLVEDDCEVSLTGMPVDPAMVEITINPGYNWIGFTGTEEVSVEAALADFDAEDGDAIEGTEGMTEYLGDGMWWGDFETFVPGQGYMYNSASDEVKTLYFNLGGEKARSSVVVSGSLTKQPVKAEVKSEAAKAVYGNMAKTKDSVKKTNK